MPVNLDALSLRKNERGFVAGGTGCGKSTLSDSLADDFLTRYYASGARELVLDSKPRYRAEEAPFGPSPRKRYKHWDHGPKLAGSAVVDDPEDMAFAWSLGYRRIIVQGDSQADIPRLVRACSLFLADSRAKRPQLLRVDETMDFFHPNTAPKGGDDAVLRAARGGRERGTACLYCTQRTKGIPTQLLEELTRLYAFRMDFLADAKRFQEAGAPPFALPKKDFDFKYWYKADRDRVWGPYKLTLDQAA